MKIAFLNPWRNAAENQAFASLRIAANRVNHQMIHCTNSAEIDHCSPDFVLVSASTQAKLNDYPHYGIIHEPRDRFLSNRAYFNNLLSYDGYLTISDTLKRFLRDVNYGAGRTAQIGFYYNTCQSQDKAADLAPLFEARALKITYFGTNWDKRRQRFFQILGGSDNVQIFGPESSWTHISRNAYGGSVDFDGDSVQAKYVANGIGLCMLSDQHLADDVVSNRIFEITSVGAIALCCDVPWIRRYFGDSVYYFDQNLNDYALRDAIMEIRETIYADPAAAIRKARRAREIFETTFSAEIMVQNAVRYHEAASADRTRTLKRREQAHSPLISIVMRCGSHAIEYLQRAVQSVARQTFGEFEVILVRHKELDVSSIVDRQWQRIRSIRLVDSPNGNRSASLWAGLNCVQGQYWAVLDEDDWWFSNHFEELLRPFPNASVDSVFGYSGSIVVCGEPQAIDGGGEDLRFLYCFGIDSLESWNTVASAFASNCFVASADLLTADVLTDPGMDSAEDSYLILSLLAGVDPVFSYSATSVFDRSLPGQSNFADHPRRREDELTLMLRLAGRRRPRCLPAIDTWKDLAEFWEKMPPRMRDAGNYEVLPSDWETVASGFEKKQSYVCSGSTFGDPQTGSAAICPPVQPWAYGAELALKRPTRSAVEYAVVAEFAVKKGVIGIGILNVAGDGFLFRKKFTADASLQTVQIRVQDLKALGRFVVQNWEVPAESHVDLVSVRMFAGPA